MAGKQIEKTPSKTEQEVAEVDVKKIGENAVKGAEVKAELDDLLDEIDEVLEVNADEFVKNYIQKGGQ